MWIQDIDFTFENNEIIICSCGARCAVPTYQTMLFLSGIVERRRNGSQISGYVLGRQLLPLKSVRVLVHTSCTPLRLPCQPLFVSVLRYCTCPVYGRGTLIDEWDIPRSRGTCFISSSFYVDTDTDHPPMDVCYCQFLAEQKRRNWEFKDKSAVFYVAHDADCPGICQDEIRYMS